MPSVPMDHPMVSRKKLFSCSAHFTTSPRPGLTADKTSEPCNESANTVAKKNETASMCAGL